MTIYKNINLPTITDFSRLLTLHLIFQCLDILSWINTCMWFSILNCQALDIHLIRQKNKYQSKKWYFFYICWSTNWLLTDHSVTSLNFRGIHCIQLLSQLWISLSDTSWNNKCNSVSWRSVGNAWTTPCTWKKNTKLVANVTYNSGDKAGFCVHRCLNMKKWTHQ